MNNEQALQVLKSTIDEAIRKGVVPNMETAQQIIIALGIIAKAIQNEEK
jgi:hypothetical protein